MDDQEKDLTWELYEQIAAAFAAENEGAGIEISATKNARIVGAISGVERQIDLLIDARWRFDRSRRVIVDAKYRRRRLDVKDIESFEGMMKDCRAEHGILVCSSGWSTGAERRAQDLITLKLMSVDELGESTAWAWFAECAGPCAGRAEPRTRGVVLWDGQLPWGIGNLWAIIFTGKCDVCHNFQIWCWDCGEVLSLGVNERLDCSCERTWSSVPIRAQNANGEEATIAVQLCLTTEQGTAVLEQRNLR